MSTKSEPAPLFPSILIKKALWITLHKAFKTE